MFPSTIDAIKERRADSARSYHWLVAGHANIKVFMNSPAENLTWRDLEDHMLAPMESR